MKNILSVIGTVMISVGLIGSGSLAAFAASQTVATTSATDIVVPGGTNTAPFDINVEVNEAGSLQDVHLIESRNVDFARISADTGATYYDFRSVNTHSIGSTGLTLSFPDAVPNVRVDAYTYLLGYNSADIIDGESYVINFWDYPALNTHIKFSLEPGSLSFAGTGPWELKVLALYGTTGRPAAANEYFTITLTEPAPVAPNSTADESALAVTGSPFALWVGLTVLSFICGVVLVVFSRMKSAKFRGFDS